MTRVEDGLGIRFNGLDRMNGLQQTIQDGHRNDLISTDRERLNALMQSGFQMIDEVITPEGLYASRDPRFRHFFWRDMVISMSGLRKWHALDPQPYLYDKGRSAVLGFVIRTQRENGSPIHEEKIPSEGELPHIEKFENFYEVVNGRFVNPNAIDAAPLALSEIPQLFLPGTLEFEEYVGYAYKSLRWMIKKMDGAGGWLSYHYDRLINQGWMDSWDSTKHSQDDLNTISVKDSEGEIMGFVPPDPITLVEVQGYAWQALRTWSDLLKQRDPEFSKELRMRAENLKRRFNIAFLTHDDKGYYFAQALDGKGIQIESRTINPALCLWAAYNGESIIADEYIPDVIARLMHPDFFDSEAGIRTFEKGQLGESTGGYHREEDCQWPAFTSQAADGITNFGAVIQADEIRKANLKGFLHFGSFYETGTNNGKRKLYEEDGKVKSCLWHTWSAVWGMHDISRLSLAQAA